MRENTNSQAKQRNNQKPKGAAQKRDQQSTASTMITTAANTVASSLGGLSSMKSTFDTFARAIDELTLRNASEAAHQVQEAFEQATVTANHAKKTIDLAQAAYKSIRETAKDVIAKAKENPEPFIAAAIPAVVGIGMIIVRSQTFRRSGVQKNPGSSRSLARQQ